MRKTVMVGIGIAGIVLLVAFGSGAPPAQAAELDGKALFVDTHKCNMCHAVPAAGIEAKTTSEKMKGADLGGPVKVDFEKLASYLRKESDMDGASHKKPFKGTDEELQTIIDWLGSLEAQE